MKHALKKTDLVVYKRILLQNTKKDLHSLDLTGKEMHAWSRRSKMQTRKYGPVTLY